MSDINITLDFITKRDKIVEMLNISIAVLFLELAIYEKTIEASLLDEGEENDIKKYRIHSLISRLESELENKRKYQYIIDKYNHKKPNRTIDSYNLVKFLFNNKATHLVPIEFNLSILKTQFYDMVEDTEILEYDEDELSAALATKKGCKKLTDEAFKQFSKAVKKHIGEESTMFRLKVITDPKGKWVQLPKDGTVAESLEVPRLSTSLSISNWELKNSQKGLSMPTESADKKGEGPGQKVTATKSNLNI